MNNIDVYKKSKNIFENGLEAIQNGDTSYSELLRVSQSEWKLLNT